jgi:hypothetical protein
MENSFAFTNTKHPKIFLTSNGINLELPTKLSECQLMVLQDLQQKIIDIAAPLKGRIKIKES